LRHVRENLRPGGWLYLSASGVSDTINAGYARLYADDSRRPDEAAYFHYATCRAGPEDRSRQA
jgi:hypothetical protein